MTQPPAPIAAPPPPARWRTFGRRLLIGGIVVLVVLALALLLLPRWISSEQGRKYVVDRINRRLAESRPGAALRIAVDDWSLGWFRTTEVTNLRILQPDGTSLAACPRLTSGITFWKLYRGDYDLGHTTADHLEIRIVKFVDGSSSLDSFGPVAGEVLRSIRGAIQIRDAGVEVVSQRAGESVRWRDLKAALTIAAPEAPFHVSITGSPTGDSAVSLTATMRPIRELSLSRRWDVLAFAARGDVDLTMTHLPAGLVCDILSLDRAWTESFGGTIDLLQVTGHSVMPQETQRISLTLRGHDTRPGPAPALDARVLVQLGGDGPRVVIPAGDDDYALLVQARMSSPLGRLLERLHPVLGEVEAPQGGLVRAVVHALDLPLDARKLHEGRGAARLEFPPLVFVPHDGPSVTRQLQIITGELPRPAGGSPVEGRVEPLRVTLRDNRWHYENLLMTMGSGRISFSGSVGLDGELALLAVIPVGGTGLAGGRAQVVIAGTVEAPLVRRAE